MHRKRERILWVSVTAVLILGFAIILLSPAAAAQSLGRSPVQEYIRELEAAIHVLSSSYVDEVDAEELFEGAMDGIFAALDDPYSAYLRDDAHEQMTDTTHGKYGGVGLYIVRERFDPENPYGRLPYVKVVSPIEDTPSWRAGIKSGDYIYAIEGESAEGYSTDDVKDRLRGRPGSDVNVTILRGNDITFDVVLKRAEIEIPTVKTTVIGDNIGFLRIAEFTPFTAERVRDTLKEFSGMGLENLIVDVRNNPGGLLDAVVDVADLFFSGGVVVSTQYRQDRQNRVLRASPGKLVPANMKIAVLIDRGSASASEILTGALKDRGRAVVIGEKSFGKGSIQQMIPVRNNSAAIKLTTGRYYTPNGSNIDKTGITPDIVVEEPELTPEQSKAYARILQENRVGSFIDEVPEPGPGDVNRFIRMLNRENLNPGERIIRLMVKRESERRMDVPPVVDLEYDRVLIRAMRFLESGS